MSVELLPAVFVIRVCVCDHCKLSLRTNNDQRCTYRALRLIGATTTTVVGHSFCTIERP